MKIKKELQGSKIYVKALNSNIEVNDRNIEILVSVNADVFEPEELPSPRKKKDDNNKSGDNE